MGIKFGRVKSSLDYRDFNLRSFSALESRQRTVKESNWPFNSNALDQGDTPHCTGFAAAGFGINMPTYSVFTNKDGHRFYYDCKVIDGEPLAETGSSIRSVAKVLKNNNYIRAYAFAPDINTIKWWLLYKGPLIVGTEWTSDMMKPDKNNIISIGGDVVGGHAYVINEFRSDSYVGIQNSWGNKWGNNGKAYIKLDDLEKLFIHDGEVLTAVELEPDQKKRKCFLVSAFENTKRGSH